MNFFINQLFVDGLQGSSKTKFYDKKKKKIKSWYLITLNIMERITKTLTHLLFLFWSNEIFWTISLSLHKKKKKIKKEKNYIALAPSMLILIFPQQLHKLINFLRWTYLFVGMSNGKLITHCFSSNWSNNRTIWIHLKWRRCYIRTSRNWELLDKSSLTSLDYCSIKVAPNQ